MALDGDAFWIVTEHAHRANYVRNIEANPRVRVRSGRKWRAGTAQPVDEDPEVGIGTLIVSSRSCRASTINLLTPRARRIAYASL
jgi:deazaflavin-dependent oxidoreductase (nitroreductase family)